MIINQRGVRRVGKKSKDMGVDDDDSKQKKRRDGIKRKSNSNASNTEGLQKTKDHSPKKINQKEFEKIYKSDQF